MIQVEKTIEQSERSSYINVNGTLQETNKQVLKGLSIGHAGPSTSSLEEFVAIKEGGSRLRLHHSMDYRPSLF